MRVDIEAGAEYPKHTHLGEEIIYVIEGLLEYQVEGKPTVTLKEGDVYFIPARTIHSVRNVGSIREVSWLLISLKKRSRL